MTSSSAPRRRRFRLDPDQRKWLKILIVVVLLAWPMWLVGKQRCGWLLAPEAASDAERR